MQVIAQYTGTMQGTGTIGERVTIIYTKKMYRVCIVLPSNFTCTIESRGIIQPALLVRGVLLCRSTKKTPWAESSRGTKATKTTTKCPRANKEISSGPSIVLVCDSNVLMARNRRKYRQYSGNRHHPANCHYWLSTSVPSGCTCTIADERHYSTGAREGPLLVYDIHGTCRCWCSSAAINRKARTGGDKGRHLPPVVIPACLEGR